MIEECLIKAMTYMNLLKDYLFSKHNMNEKTNSNDNDS